MKTPKEKAKELVGKYNDYLQQEMQCIVYVNQPKQCALIAVDEVLETLYNLSDCSPLVVEKRDYYEEVKKEIQNHE